MHTERIHQTHSCEIMIGAYGCFHTILFGTQIILDKVLIGTKQQQNYVDEVKEKKMKIYAMILYMLLSPFDSWFAISIFDFTANTFFSWSFNWKQIYGIFSL